MRSPGEKRGHRGGDRTGRRRDHRRYLGIDIDGAGDSATPPAVSVLHDAGIHPDELLSWQTAELLWRVHRTTGGSHILPWNGMRTFGPILRFDHHPLPRGERHAYGLWYGAASPRGALAEAFQSARVIDRHYGDPYLTALRFARPLRLLDVAGIGGGAWATRVGGNHALDSAAHGRTQHWARAIHRKHDDLDGIIYRVRFAGSVCISLVERATDAFPRHPAVSMPLAHPALAGPIDTTARQLGYAIT